MYNRCCKTCQRPMPPEGVLVFDADSMMTMAQGRAHSLPNGEFLILQALLARPGKVVSRESLENAASLQDADPSALNVTICRLRARIGKDRIVSFPGAGYKLTGRVKLEAIA